MEPDPTKTAADVWRAARDLKQGPEAPPKAGLKGSQAQDQLAPPGPRRKSPRRDSPRQTLADPVPMLDVDAAMKEITKVPAATIHRSAAFAWASRAIAAYRVCAGKLAIQEGLSYLYLGEHYREAALAHAAMGEAWQPLFNEIDEAMSKDRASAFASLRGRSPVATR